MAGTTQTPTKLRGWVRALLIGSVTLNLIVAGVVVGGILRHDGHPPRIGEVSFGDMSYALDRADRDALRGMAERRGASFRDFRAQDRADREALIALLQAEPFDADAYDRLMAQQHARMSERISMGAGMMRERIMQMDAPARRAFAERLREGSRRFGPEGRTGGAPTNRN
ncbi:periplasmic heavy metal sensor [Thioclava sp. A2]|uniref:periplasmic heavy metal sensor n=1 Tax=Thioclava sp. FCG-A2 TaxID=3080562 RepID=UPI0029551661|nr:periplasmic heavy metal sensor [Thioclava sp. A2]MDV7272241.1 periplasmic heavy metal sensor [Thioclava sp. A2]